MIPKKQLKNLLDFSLDIVKSSEKISLKYYKSGTKPEYKANNSPVTIADYKLEDFLIKKINQKYHEHNILSEERGEKNHDSEFKWIIDPIDGTKNFIRHIPFWGTLLALEYQGKVIVGVINMPVLKEIIYAAKGIGCYCNGKKINVSSRTRLKDSYIIYGGLHHIMNNLKEKNYAELNDSFSESRGFGDCHGHSFILKGTADALVDPCTAPYDIAPTKICIDEAGGKFTDLKGTDSIYGGNALITNGLIHNKVLKILNKKNKLP